MPLCDQLHRAAGGRDTHSFELMGEELALMTGAHLRGAALAYAEALERVPAPLRDEFEAEQARIQAEAYRWLRRFNRSVHTRLRGYLELGRLCRFAYPWPVVAMLGICQVMEGLARTHLFGLLGGAARRLRYHRLEELAEGSADVLRRTNRGIFADSVPTVLYALRCVDLRRADRADLADALLDGPLPLMMDEESRAVARALADALAGPDSGDRFRVLAELTSRHFAREQAVFSYHLGSRSDRKPPPATGLALRMTALTQVPAPVVVSRGGIRRVVFRPYRLPAGFDIRDHDARVSEFGRAYVDSITRSAGDYRAAIAYVEERFGRPAAQNR